MKKIERKIKNNLINEFKDSDINDSLKKRVFNNLGLNYQEKKPFFTFKKLTIISSFACLLLVAIIGSLLIFNKEPNQKISYKSIVQMDLNPSIEFIVENDEVKSIRGLNDEGKMLVLNEEFENINLNDAINKIINLEKSTGYLSDESQISITVSSNEEETNNYVKDKITNIISNIKSEDNLSFIYNFNDSKTLDELVSYVKELCPYINSNNLDYDALVNSIINYNNEVKDFTSVKLEELYLKFKDDYYNKKLEEYIKNLVNNLDDIYKTSIEYYNELYNSFVEAYEDVENTYFEYFIDDESLYQQSLKAIEEKKVDYLNQKKIVEEAKNDSLLVYQIEKGKLLILESEYNVLKETLSANEQLATTTYNAVLSILDNIISELDELKQILPTSIRDITYSDLLSFEEYKNLDNTIYQEFINKYSSYIEIINNNTKKNKENLQNN